MHRSGRDYRRFDGFTLTADVAHQFIDDVHELEIPQIGSQLDIKAEGLKPSSGSLYLITSQVNSRVEDLIKEPGFADKYGITPDDLGPKNHFKYENGFADQNFVFNFAGGMAHSVVARFEQKGYITQEQRASMTLGDWADVIGSGWFAELVHDLAFTKLGMYGFFGRSPRDYTDDRGIEGQLNEQHRLGVKDVLDIGSKYDEVVDRTYLTAGAKADFRYMLRKLMKEARSLGCPVARHAGSLSLEFLEADLHARRLVDEGNLTITSVHQQVGKARFKQEYTPIDKGLIVLADLLDSYDASFGTPYVRMRKQDTKLVHERRRKTEALIHEGKALFEQLERATL